MYQGSFKEQLAAALKSKDYPAAIKLLEASKLPDRAERVAKLRERQKTERENSPAAQIEKAKALIQAKQYDDARALLITIDDPAADRLLERMESIHPVKVKNAPVVVMHSDKSFTGKLVLTVVLLFILFLPGLIALTIFAGEAKRYPDAPGAGTLILLNKFIFWIFAAVLVLVVLSLILVGNAPAVQMYNNF